MPSEGSNFLGAMQNTTEERRNSENTAARCNNNNNSGTSNNNNNPQQQSSSASSYLILSPANPIRTFAISFLTHWIYSTVIILTICAFVISSAYCNFWCTSGSGERGETVENEHVLQRGDFSILIWTRRILFAIILLEVLTKSIARGFLVGALSYLRIAWDWLDVISLILLFVAIIFPWKAADSLAAGIVLFKLIPIHPGSINAFTSLCFCAKKLIPTVLVYGIIIIWMYGILIFTLFVKYQHFENSETGDTSVIKTNGSATSDSRVENENITDEIVATPSEAVAATFVDGDYLTLSTSKKSQNFSFGLSGECLPTNLRSLSGSLLEACQMLTLGFSQSERILRGNISNLNKLESVCQYEIYTLSIVETLVIMSGTLPMITMTFGALYDFFQKDSNGVIKLSLQQHDDNEAEQESQTSYQYQHQRRRLGSTISGRSNNSHSQNDCDEGSSSSCLNSSFFKQLANLLCDCDYYFCCLANLQRRLNPCATRLLNSKRFKVCVMLVVSLDFLCMIMLLWFSSNHDERIDFSPTELITYCLQICFVLYTIEAVFKWFAFSSDEYWLNIWSAFDLTLVIVYWIGYTVIRVCSYHSFYSHFCGVLMIRMLKVVPYCKPLQHSLKLMGSSVLGKVHYLFVIFICSCSTVMLKYAIYKPEMEPQWRSSTLLIDNTSNAFYFHTVVKYFCLLILYFLCSVVIICVFIQAIEILKCPQGRQRVHPRSSISFLLNDSHSEELVNMQFQQPRRSINESASPISIMTFPGGASPSPMKYRLSASPCSSNNGLLLHETQSMLSPSSDLLSPFLSIPISNGLNGHVHHHNHHLHHHHHHQPPFDDENCHVSPEANIRRSDNDNNGIQQDIIIHSCSSTERALDLASSGVIVFSSVNIALDSSETGVYNMSWDSLHPGRSLWLEVLFIACITAHIIYKTRLNRFSRETFIQISCVCDLLMVLAAVVEVFSSGMKWFPLKDAPSGLKVFVNCANVLSACRGLLLFSRISWLQSVGYSLYKNFWSVATYLSSFGYLWLIFLFCSSEAQKTIISIAQYEADSIGSSTATLEGNYSRKPNSTDSDNINDEVFIPHPSLILLTVLLFLLTFGGFWSLFIHNIGGWNEVIKKYAFCSQLSRLDYLLNSSEVHNSSTASQFNKPTEGICVPVLYFVTNHLTFDVIIMTLILFDGLGITLEHLATSERALILRRHYPAYMLFLYLLELTVKLAGNGLHLFKSNWNIFDAVVITVYLIDFLVSLIFHNNYVAVLILNVRFLRVLRIFQFYPFAQRAQLIQKFFLSISKVYVLLRNFGIFYFSLFLIAIIFRLRCTHFIPIEQNPTLWIAAPFQVINAQTIFEVIGNLKLASFSVEYIFFFCCLLLFSLIRISVIFSTWLVLVATLGHLLMMHEQGTLTGAGTEINTYHLNRADGAINESVDFDDKYSYLLPCTSPETIDIETPSSSGTNSRVHASNTLGCVVDNHKDDSEPGAVQSNAHNNSLYKTTTITSSEEINGCKVFYVEAMITTV